MPTVEQGVSVDGIDLGVKNKWRWNWLDATSVVNKTTNETCKYSDWCKKVDKPGVCMCTVCNREIKYGSSGKKALNKHAELPDHIKAFTIRKACETVQVAGPTLEQPVSALVEKKARLLAFVAEHSFPYSLVPDLIDLSQSLSDNKCKSLSKLNLSRHAATYTSTHGLAAMSSSTMSSSTAGPSTTPGSSSSDMSSSKQSSASTTARPTQPDNTHPKGGKRAALQSTSDISRFFKKPRKDC